MTSAGTVSAASWIVIAFCLAGFGWDTIRTNVPIVTTVCDVVPVVTARSRP